MIKWHAHTYKYTLFNVYFRYSSLKNKQTKRLPLLILASPSQHASHTRLYLLYCSHKLRSGLLCLSLAPLLSACLSAVISKNIWATSPPFQLWSGPIQTPRFQSELCGTWPTSSTPPPNGIKKKVQKKLRTQQPEAEHRMTYYQNSLYFTVKTTFSVQNTNQSISQSISVFPSVLDLRLYFAVISVSI